MPNKEIVTEPLSKTWALKSGLGKEPLTIGLNYQMVFLPKISIKNYSPEEQVSWLELAVVWEIQKKKKELESFFRFSFGPLEEESFDDDCLILAEALLECQNQL